MADVVLTPEAWESGEASTLHTSDVSSGMVHGSYVDKQATLRTFRLQWPNARWGRLKLVRHYFSVYGLGGSFLWLPPKEGTEVKARFAQAPAWASNSAKSRTLEVVLETQRIAS